jgi:hypothetical protein
MKKIIPQCRKIAPNDIKSGQLVLLTDGTIITVSDNKKGIIREVETNGDRGSSYVFDWDAARDTEGRICEVQIPDSYRIKEKRIRAMGLL